MIFRVNVCGLVFLLYAQISRSNLVIYSGSIMGSASRLRSASPCAISTLCPFSARVSLSLSRAALSPVLRVAPSPSCSPHLPQTTFHKPGRENHLLWTHTVNAVYTLLQTVHSGDRVDQRTGMRVSPHTGKRAYRPVVSSPWSAGDAGCPRPRSTSSHICRRSLASVASASRTGFRAMLTECEARRN